MREGLLMISKAAFLSASKEYNTIEKSVPA